MILHSLNKYLNNIKELYYWLLIRFKLMNSMWEMIIEHWVLYEFHTVVYIGWICRFMISPNREILRQTSIHQHD